MFSDIQRDVFKSIIMLHMETAALDYLRLFKDVYGRCSTIDVHVP